MSEMTIRLRLDDDAALLAALEVASGDPSISSSVVPSTDAADSSGTATEQIEPVTTMLVGAGILAGARFVMSWWERVQGGLVIDHRPEAKQSVYRDRSVPYGFIITFPVDGGKATVDVKDEPKDATERLLGQVISGVLGTVEAVKEAVAQILGPSKSTGVEAHDDARS